MTKKKRRNKNLKFAANMPPLYHTLPGEDFSHDKSEVLEWISERPGLLNYVFSHAANAKEIFYDSSTGKWQGVDYEEDE